MRYLSFLVLFLLALPSLAQNELALQHISVLTSDSLYGRGFTNKGQEKAADYIIEQLRNNNVKAAFKTGYQQKLAYPVNTFPGDVGFSVHNEDATKIYAAGKDYLYHPGSAPIDVKGEIQKVTTQYEFDTNKKKVIFYIEKTNRNEDDLNDFIDRFLFSAKKSNQLLIIQDSSKWSWYPSSTQGENSVLYVKDKLVDGSEISTFNEASFNPNFSSSNIIGKIEGDRSDSVLLFSAHYDHIGQMGSAIFKGANDNASGVAMLLELSKFYMNNKAEFDTYFLFTTAEEIGLQGSYHFIENPAFDLRKIKLLINLDMVGTGEEGITVVNAKKNHRYFELLQEFNTTAIEKIKERGEACNSDHCLFDSIGVPAIFIYTLGGKQAYHDVYDDGENLSLYAFDALKKLIIESLKEY